MVTETETSQPRSGARSGPCQLCDSGEFGISKKETCRENAQANGSHARRYVRTHSPPEALGCRKRKTRPHSERRSRVLLLFQSTHPDCRPHRRSRREDKRRSTPAALRLRLREDQTWNAYIERLEHVAIPRPHGEDVEIRRGVSRQPSCPVPYHGRLSRAREQVSTSLPSCRVEYIGRGGVAWRASTATILVLPFSPSRRDPVPS